MQAARLLDEGRLVAIPTETVYGLAADASNEHAVRKVFEAKQRPLGHPLIVHVASAERIALWAESVPDVVWRLTETYWPGPLTILLPKKQGVSDVITGGHPGVAIRMPAHPVALKMIEALGRDVVAPSANPYGRISPTSSEHVQRGLAGRIDAVLDGGECSVGIESTILDLTGSVPAIARPGLVAQSQLEQFLGVSFVSGVPATMAVPGNVKQHYQPVTRTLGITSDRFRLELSALISQPGRTGVIWWQTPPPESDAVEAIQLSAEPELYARMIYTALHVLDQADLDRIVIEWPPQTEAWRALHDRLSRACA